MQHISRNHARAGTACARVPV